MVAAVRVVVTRRLVLPPSLCALGNFSPVHDAPPSPPLFFCHEGNAFGRRVRAWWARNSFLPRRQSFFPFLTPRGAAQSPVFPVVGELSATSSFLSLPFPPTRPIRVHLVPLGVKGFFSARNSTRVSAHWNSVEVGDRLFSRISVFPSPFSPPPKVF